MPAVAVVLVAGAAVAAAGIREAVADEAAPAAELTVPLGVNLDTA